jgi:hypothetical protein
LTYNSLDIVAGSGWFLTFLSSQKRPKQNARGNQMVLRTLLILLLALYGGIVWVVVKEFRQTHNFGFLILGFGVIVWPMAADVLTMNMQHFLLSLTARAQVTPGFIFDYGFKLIQASLILTGLLVVSRSINGTRPHLAGH